MATTHRMNAFKRSKSPSSLVAPKLLKIKAEIWLKAISVPDRNDIMPSWYADKELDISKYFQSNQEQKKGNLQNHGIWIQKKIELHHKEDFSERFPPWAVLWVDFWINVGSELNGLRPCITVKQTVAGYWSDTIVIPLSTLKEEDDYKEKKDEFDVEIRPTASNFLTDPSYAKVRQIRNVSLKRIRARSDWKFVRGNISDADMEEIRQNLSKMFGI